RVPIDRVHPKNISITHLDSTLVGRAKPSGRLRQRVQHRRKIEGRSRNDLENVRGRRLLLQRFSEVTRALTQFIEQPRILDGDDGLGGEILYQRNLFVGKGTNFLTIDRNGTDQLIIFEHWHHEKGASAARVSDGPTGRIAFEVRGRGTQVIKMY